MALKHYLDLLLILILNTILVLVILFIPLDALRVVLGLPYVLFFPGYTLLAALFIRRGSLDGIERLALCIGVSIAVVPLIGLVLNYTPWGINLLPSLLSLYVFMLAMSVIAFFRRQTLVDDERFCFEFSRAPLAAGSALEDVSAPDEPREVVSGQYRRSPLNRYFITALISLFLLILGLVISAEAWQIGLSIPLVLAAGYSLSGIVFPRDDDLTPVVRVFMSLCFSVLLGLLVAIIMAVIPDFTQSLFIAVYVVFASVAIALALAAAWLRYRLNESAYHAYKVAGKAAGVAKIRWLDRFLNVLLVLAILAAIGAIVHVVATPAEGEKFTEFYILGLEGKAEKYPRELQPGEEASVILGIVNREHAAASYMAVVSIDGLTLAEYGPILLEHEAKWEQIISFKPVRSGHNQKAEFLLFKDGAADVYLTLHLWLDVVR